MICHRCLHRRTANALSHLSSPLPLSRPIVSSSRSLSTSSSRQTAETLPPTAAPPFSTPFTPQSVSTSDAPEKPPRSSTAEGTLLKGLGYIKGQNPPLAKADDQYPEWLWGLLDETGKASKTEGEGADGDMFSKSKKQRRVAAKLARKAALEDPSSLVPKVPLQHQSIDLPHGEGTGKEGEEGRKAREVLTKTMRAVRRKGIKEKNFLTGMR